MRKTTAILAIVLAAAAVVILHSATGIAQPAQTQPAGGTTITDLGPMEIQKGVHLIFSHSVKNASQIPVTFDGHVSKFEYGDATHTTFANGHGTVDVFIKVSDGYLYFAYQIPDLSPFMGDDMVTMLDLKNERAAAPSKTDIRAYVRRKMENSRTQEGDGEKWVDNYGPWEYRSALYANGWEVETRISLAALGLPVEDAKAIPGRPIPAAAVKTTLGLAFRIWDNEPEKNWNWPAGSSEKKPSTWGTLVIE